MRKYRNGSYEHYCSNSDYSFKNTGKTKDENIWSFTSTGTGRQGVGSFIHTSTYASCNEIWYDATRYEDVPPIAGVPVLKGRTLSHAMPHPFAYNCAPDHGRKYLDLARRGCFFDCPCVSFVIVIALI